MRKRVLSVLLTGAMAVGMFAGMAVTGSAEGDPEEIVVRFMCLGTVPSDLQAVEDAINEITIPEINVKVSYEAISAASYLNQLALDMTAGEQVDVFYVSNYASMLQSNQLLDLSPYLEEYGQDIVSAVSEEWLKATSVGDAVYATPAICGKAATMNIAMRTDILEELGYSIDDFEMYDDYEDEGMQATLAKITEIFAAAKEAHPEMITLCTGDSGDAQLENLIQCDSLSDGYGVLMGDEGWEVVNLFETEEYKDVLEQVREWYLAGYIKSDAATDTESYNSYASAGRMFSVFSVSEVGLDNQLKNSSGYDYTCVKIKTPMLTSSNLSGLCWGVSTTTKVPEAAVKFLNLAYASKDLENLMCYGVEGVHWQYAESGAVDYADGVDSQTTGYPFSTYWEMPNSLAAAASQGNPGDYNEILLANNAAANTSRALGFAFDQTPVKTEVTAVDAVLTEYRAGLLSGSLDLDENYDTFIEKLKSAGIDTIIAEKQSQLDAWCEENGIER